MASTPWLDDDWRATALSWASAMLAEHGFAITGEVEQPHVRVWSTAFRITSGERLFWLKANCPGNLYEAPLVEALGRWVPDEVVVPLAIDVERGWLLSPDAGATLRAQPRDESADGRLWERALAQFAGLQRAVEPKVEELLALGVPDRRPEALPGMLAQLLGDTDELLLGRPGGIPADRYRKLVELQPRYADWCTELAAIGVAASIQHEDLHDANILPVDGRYAFFDWGDACVGHPFGVLLVALRVAVHRGGAAKGSPELERIRDAYLAAWRPEFEWPELRRAAELAIRTAKVGRAMSYHRALCTQAPADRGDDIDAVWGWLAELLEPDVL